MKKIFSLPLVLMLSMLLTGGIAEEYFAEESFKFDVGPDQESLFEEVFFTDDCFIDDSFAVESVDQTGVSEIDKKEDRTLLAMTDTVDDGGGIFYGTPLGEAPELLKPSVIDAKPNAVKLEWKHYYNDGYTQKSVKLPAGVAYYVYESDFLKNGVWHQVAKTTKRTITLKNQVHGSHTYFVRAEYTGKGGEQYGKRSNSQSISIEDVGMWKSFKQVSIFERKTVYSNTTGIDPIVRIRTKEQPEYIKLGFTVKYKSGITFTWPMMKYKSVSWSLIPVPGGYEFETEINLNNTGLTDYTSSNGKDILRMGYTDYAQSLSVSVMPAQWDYYKAEYVEGKKSSGSLKKIHYESDKGKAKPIIHSVYQRGMDFQISVTFPATGITYGIYDGSHLVGTYSPAKTEPYIFVRPLANLGKPGAHKIAVALVTWDGKKYKTIGEKATYTLNVPAPLKAPVTVESNLKIDGNTVKGTFCNNNQKASSFEIQLFDKNGKLRNTSYVKANNEFAAKGTGYDQYSFSMNTMGGSTPFRVIIKTYVSNQKYEIIKEFVSDVYLTDGSIVSPKR